MEEWNSGSSSSSSSSGSSSSSSSSGSSSSSSGSGSVYVWVDLWVYSIHRVGYMATLAPGSHNSPRAEIYLKKFL